MTLHGWESAVDGRRVLLDESVVRDLRLLAIEGFTALRRRGLEIGGLLVGKSDSGELRVEDFEQVPCEHRYGPSYALSDTDRENLATLLAQPQRPGTRVVGFFRSFTARDPLIEEADEAFVSAHFPECDFVFLMLQPYSAERCLAGIRFFRDGVLQPASDEPPFAFEPNRMPVMQLVIQESAAQPEESAAQPEESASQPEQFATQPEEAAPQPEQSAAQPEEAAPLLEQSAAPPEEPGPQLEQPAAQPEAVRLPPRPILPPARRTRTETSPVQPVELRGWSAQPAPTRSAVLVPGMVCLAALLGALGVYELNPGGRNKPPASTPPAFAELKLDARESGGKVLVSWDAAAARSLSASHGALTIADGDAQQEIELNQPQIASGQYTYAAAHPGVGIRLTLSSEGRTVASEAVRLTPVAREAPPAAAASPAAPSPASGAPLVVHEVHPFIPEGIRSRIREQVVVPVEVRVGEHGRVLSARADAAAGDSVHRYLVSQAVKAARQWRFKPPPAPTVTTIQFTFAP
jgi:TonB family protein